MVASGNDIVKKFTPGVKGKSKGVKFVFDNGKYIVKIGYAIRIFENF